MSITKATLERILMARARRASNWLGGNHDAYIAAVIELDRLEAAHDHGVRQSA